MEEPNAPPSPELRVRVKRSKSATNQRKFQTIPSEKSTEEVVAKSGSTNSVTVRQKKPLIKRKSFRISSRFLFSTPQDKLDGQPAKPKIIQVSEFSHKEHISSEGASAFLQTLLRRREERYLHDHRLIRDGTCRSLMEVRPPIHMIDQFEKIVFVPPGNSFRRKKKGKETRYHQFWVELVPQTVSKKPVSLSYQVHDLQEQPGYVKSMSDLNDYQSSSFEKRRFEQIVYFPENLPNCNNKNKSSMLSSIPHSGQLPKGAPDYMLTLYQSDSKTNPFQVLAVVPLSDVKISVISPNEFTISYVNKLPNTHFFRLQTNELCQSWINSLGLAIQQDINYPFIGINTRSNSFSNSFAMIRGTASKLSLKSSKSHSLGPLHKPDIQDEQFEGYYKPIRLDIDELRRESGGCLSNLLQLQEVYYSSEALEFDRSSPVKQGWRPLGGTFTDLLYWCLLTSDRSDKMNIDATALFLEFPFKDIMEELQNIWITLKNAVCGQKNKKKSGKKKLKTANGTSGNQISDLHAVAEDEISMMFTLELKLYNFIQQWMIISQYFANDPHSETFKIDKDSLFQFITLQLTKSHAERLLECYKQTQPKKATITFAAVVPVPTTPVLPNDSAIKLLGIKVNTLAEQLTLIEIDLFNQLRLSELLHLKWEKDPEKAGGVRKLISNYNRIGMWVATEILSCANSKTQAKVFSYFLKVANKLKKLKNYATCAQILSGISNRAVQRLKKLTKHLDHKALEHYERLNDDFDPISGYLNYRKKLDHTPPTIPLIAVHLHILTLIEEGNPKMLDEEGRILSFARMVMSAECIAEINLCEESVSGYQFQPIDDIQRLLLHSKVLDEESLFKISQQLEPLRGGLAKKKVPRIISDPADDNDYDKKPDTEDTDDCSEYEQKDSLVEQTENGSSENTKTGDRSSENNEQRAERQEDSQNDSELLKQEFESLSHSKEKGGNLSGTEGEQKQTNEAAEDQYVPLNYINILEEELNLSNNNDNDLATEDIDLLCVKRTIPPLNPQEIAAYFAADSEERERADSLSLSGRSFRGSI